MYITLFTAFKTDINHIELPTCFTFPFNYEAHPLSKIAAKELQTHLETQKDWQHNFGIKNFVDGSNIGKMFGVLVVKKSNGELGYLSAFSGKLAGKTQLPHFAPPIFDLQQDNNFFKNGEDELSAITQQIIKIENSKEYKQLKQHYERETNKAKDELKAFKLNMKQAKSLRKERKLNGEKKLSDNEFEILKETLKNESLKYQYDYKILAKEWKIKNENNTNELNVFEDKISILKKCRKQKSAKLQQELFDKYQFLNITGETKSVAEIFENTAQHTPPAGAGECAAPKLLNYAFKHNLEPICMCEFWWGQAPKSEIRKHKHFYPSCRSKCKPILGHMLKGMKIDTNPILLIPKPNDNLDIIYDDNELVVVNKPADFLSVPGKTENDCILTRVQKRYPKSTIFATHRLDMSTSGLLILAKDKETYVHIQKQFLDRSIKKRYVALLDGIINEDQGYIKLPLRVDLDHRPQQLVCYDYGKPAVTRWEKVQIEDQFTRIHLYPLTGRTHQLRVHVAHPDGLNTPIIGDDLYGIRSKRLCLHAEYIRFKHPKTGKTIQLKVETDF